MPFENENFSELNLGKIRDYVQGWVKNYPCIQKISLYRAGLEFKSIPEDDDDVKYIIVAQAPSNPLSRKKNKDGSCTFSFEYKDIKLGAEIKKLPSQKKSIESFPKLPRYQNGILEELSIECRDATLEIKAMDGIDHLVDEAIQRYPELKDIRDYYDWIKSSPREHIIKCIPDFYAIKDASLYWQRINNWFWLTINPGEDISGYNEEADDYIKENEKEILYPCSNNQTSKSVENLKSEETVSQILICENDNLEKNESKQSQNGFSFTLNEDLWEIQFEDKKVSMIDIIPIRYIVEALKYPGEVLDYSQVVTTVSGANEALDIDQDHSQMSQAQLEEEGLSIDNISYDNDIQSTFEVLLELADTCQWEKLNKGISVFEKTYEAKIILDTKGSPSRWRRKTPKQLKKALDLVSKSRKAGVKNFEYKFPALYEHLNKYLKINKGLIYDPPKGFPIWEIRDRK
ncbi:MAG: hypothetical protein HN417_09400 [Desulfobacula sp.]|jgi:hypothetical protein|nr:hypothetical protein [Desulfobacula sp.]MBT6339259.1 hypothetical protein [Desulfobacula sp.]MBT7261957.1 hypothetical protein [Desulfobacula sp.]